MVIVKNKLILVLTLVLLNLIIISGIDYSSENYQSSIAISGGGSQTTSLDYINNLIIGTISGKTFSDSYSAFLGFFNAIDLQQDTNPPIISSESRYPEIVHNNLNVSINASITDEEGNLETIWASGNWSGSWENYTNLILNGNEYSYIILSDYLENQQIVGWRYYANDSFGNLGIGDLQTFQVQNRPPSPVELMSPSNESKLGTQKPSFNWTEAIDLDGDEITYNLIISNNSEFSEIVLEKKGLIESNYALLEEESLEDKTHYYWKVYSNDSYSLNVSEIWEFEIDIGSAIAISFSEELSKGIEWTVYSLPLSNYSADGNNETGVTEYDIMIYSEGIGVDLYIKAEGDLISEGLDILGLGNMTYSFSTTNPEVPSEIKSSLTTSYADNKIASNIESGTIIYLKFFLNAPSNQPAGIYRNNISIIGVPFEYNPE